MIHDAKKLWIEKNYNKKFNEQIIMDFLMTKFGPILIIFCYIEFFSPNTYIKCFFKWRAFYMNFIDWIITT